MQLISDCNNRLPEYIFAYNHLVAIGQKRGIFYHCINQIVVIKKVYHTVNEVAS